MPLTWSNACGKTQTPLPADARKLLECTQTFADFFVTAVEKKSNAVRAFVTQLSNEKQRPEDVIKELNKDVKSAVNLIKTLNDQVNKPGFCEQLRLKRKV